MKKCLLWVLGVAAYFAVPAWAHHSFSAQFDASKPVILTGKVTEFELIMPHSWVHLQATDGTAEASAWSVEFASSRQLFRNGLNKDSLPPGMEVIIEGRLARDGTNTAHGLSIETPDGRVLYQGAIQGD